MTALLKQCLFRGLERVELLCLLEMQVELLYCFFSELCVLSEKWVYARDAPISIVELSPVNGASWLGLEAV